jgi:hypothetical protein
MFISPIYRGIRLGARLTAQLPSDGSDNESGETSSLCQNSCNVIISKMNPIASIMFRDIIKMNL